MSRHIVAGFSTAGSSVGPASWVGYIPEDTVQLVTTRATVRLLFPHMNQRCGG